MQTVVYFIQAGSGRIKLLEQEVSLLKEVQHENIIELFSVYETSSVLFMVFEYCESELGIPLLSYLYQYNIYIRKLYKITRKWNVRRKWK